MAQRGPQRPAGKVLALSRWICKVTGALQHAGPSSRRQSRIPSLPIWRWPSLMPVGTGTGWSWYPLATIPEGGFPPPGGTLRWVAACRKGRFAGRTSNLASKATRFCSRSIVSERYSSPCTRLSPALGWKRALLPEPCQHSGHGRVRRLRPLLDNVVLECAIHRVGACGSIHSATRW